MIQWQEKVKKLWETKEKRTKILFLGICACAFLISCAVLIYRNAEQKKEDQLYAELRKQVNEPTAAEVIPSKTEESVVSSPEETEEEEEETDVLEAMGIVIPEKNLDWNALNEQNSDIYAWIYVPDTEVDYPVLQHPTDNSYYLDYNLDGTKGYPGCIYTENYNNKDFLDLHTVIYGHNMKNQTMFATLHNFEDPALVEENHYIFIYTKEKVFVYLIFAAYDYSDIHLLANFNLEYEGVYARYLQGIYEVPETSTRVANIRNDVEVTDQNRILTLSTCTKDNSDYRYLVVGVLLNPL